MLRNIANSRPSIGLRALSCKPVTQVTIRHYSAPSNPDNTQKPKPTPPPVSTSNAPLPPIIKPPTLPPQKIENQHNNEEGGSSGFKIFGIGFLLAAIAAGAAHYYPDSRAKLEELGVYSTIDSIKSKLGMDSQSPHTPAESTPSEVVPPPAVPITLENEPIVVQQVHQQADVPVEVVPKVESHTLTPQEYVPITVEATEIIPVEIIQIAQPDVAPLVEEAQQVQEATPEGTPETVLSELISELEVPAPPTPVVDFQALLNAQAEQLEALKNKLQDYFHESSQASDDRAKIHESAYQEALVIRERIYKREVEDKLAQLQAQLKEQYEAARQADRNEARALMLQQVEQRSKELQAEMQHALKAATDRTEAHYSVMLADEINKFDSKLAAEVAAEEAKYNASVAERLKAIEKLGGEVTLLETVFMTNAARLKENISLHNVSSALFDLGITTLASPVRVSFVSELARLESASLALGSGLTGHGHAGHAGQDAVVEAVAAVLRPLAAVGVAPHTELQARFQTVLAQGRQAALVPEGGGILDNLVAAVAAKLIIPAKGPVQGDTPEAIFAKAEYYLQHGDLKEAVQQLSLLKGMPASIVRDWLQAASDRLTVENSLKALHAHVIVLAHQQSSKDKL